MVRNGRVRGGTEVEQGEKREAREMTGRDMCR